MDNSRQGFSLVNCVIVVALLVVLGAVLVPDYYSAQSSVTEDALRTDLRVLREAVVEYVKDHNGRPPGVHGVSASEGMFVRQLTGRTNEEGALEVNGSCGPYLESGIPPNPYNQQNTVKVVNEEDMPAVDNSTGWLFHTPSATLIVNVTGESSDGTLLTEY